ncbi:serine/threonine-protein phosphatase [Streptomyces sp. NBC_01795]|uniref:PP2C family protein-serine/threonine phosphatase n=1 Tax=unclassified Streptomyces TaxID=2593676 RepID=UPI002DD99F69|nr:MULTISPECIES: PP2C family protein-serine/threonine phosphatase [unclassified Streptomyces]WSA93815.1 serine/threonine-protein phosphatase [Streptomyces sp. NBC_01795]WSS13563.1 serine/threonine-protein phosphatase [Streptomyces sp. NBC_01186]
MNEADAAAERRRNRLRRYARLLPAVLVLVGVVLELVTPRDATFSAPFVAAPLAAAALLGLWGTITTSFLSLVFLAGFLLFRDSTIGSLETQTRIATGATVAVLAIGVNLLLRRSSDRLASARTIAEAVQIAVLPSPPASLSGLALAVRYRAAQANTRVGGDFYAAEETPHGVRLLIGDVRGKGLGAVEAVVIVVGAFREAAEQEANLGGVAARLDRALQREGRRQLGTAQYEGFTTAALVEIPWDEHGNTAGSHVIRIVNRGHPGPLLINRGRTTLLEPSVPALPLGLTELGVWPDHTDEFPFPPGSHLLLYTDGLSEARNAKGDFYDPVKRLAHSFFAHPGELLETVLADVESHTGGVSADDMALLAVAHQKSTHVTLRSDTD